MSAEKIVMGFIVDTSSLILRRTLFDDVKSHSCF